MDKTTKAALIVAGIGVTAYGVVTWYKAKKIKETVASTTESASGLVDSLSQFGDTLGDLWDTVTGKTSEGDGADQQATESQSAQPATTWYDYLDNIFS